MIDTLLVALGWLLTAAGAFFVVVAGVGLIRMPDVFTRMHAAGIADTAGAGLILVGLALVSGLTLVSAKLLIILAIILFTSPVSTHALAQAALHAGVEPLLAKPAERAAEPSATNAGSTGRRRRRTAKTSGGQTSKRS